MFQILCKLMLYYFVNLHIMRDMLQYHMNHSCVYNMPIHWLHEIHFKLSCLISYHPLLNISFRRHQIFTKLYAMYYLIEQTHASNTLRYTFLCLNFSPPHLPLRQTNKLLHYWKQDYFRLHKFISYDYRNNL